MKRAAFICPLCGHRRTAAAKRQWCKRGHQHAAMRPASVVRSVDAVLGKRKVTR